MYDLHRNMPDNNNNKIQHLYSAIFTECSRYGAVTSTVSRSIHLDKTSFNLTDEKINRCEID